MASIEKKRKRLTSNPEDPANPKRTRNSKSNTSQAMDMSQIFDNLPQDVSRDVMSRLGLDKMAKVLHTFNLSTDILQSCHTFKSTWDQNNSEKWMVIKDGDHVSFFNLHTRQWLQNALDEWLPTSCWKLKHADGGLLLYLNIYDGYLAIVYPLSMQLYYIPDITVDERGSLAGYLQNWENYYNSTYSSLNYQYISVHLMVDSASNKCEVIVIGYLGSKKVHMMVYSLPQRSWRTIVSHTAPFPWQFPQRLISNGRIYFFDRINNDLLWFKLNEEGFDGIEGQIQDQPPAFDLTFESDVVSIGIVAYKGRIILIEFECEFKRSFYISELVYAEGEHPSWEHVFTTRSFSPMFGGVTRDKISVSCDGQLIWITAPCIDSMVSIDLEAREDQLWEGLPIREFTSGNVVAFPISFKFLPAINTQRPIPT